MDILKWLDETEQPRVPQDTCRHKHSQKQPKSDSSLLEPLSLKAPSVQQKVNNHNAGDVFAASPSDCSSSSRYVRKPRRKTRPERYEPNAPKHSRQKTKPSKARHKSRQKNGQGPGQLVQSYRAKNVSGHRLTLRQPELGLFNKGRTSSAARGRGLPDLVFSEMKFLQKHDEPEPPPQPEVPRKRRKKDHTHTKEGEISSFFTSGHHVLRKETEDKHSSHGSVGEIKRRRCDRVPITDTVVPTTEIGDREPCLGFESRQARHKSTSHVSWSESVRAHNVTPPRIQSSVGICCDRHDPGRHGHLKSNTNVDEGLLELPRLPSVASKAPDNAGGRFHVSSLAPTQSKISRSQSCPQYSSSPRRLNLVDGSEKRQHCEKARSSSSMPPAVPCMLDVNSDEGLSANPPNNAESQTPQDPTRVSHAATQHQKSDNGHRSCEEDLGTSSDLGRVLQVCKDSIHDPQWAASTRIRGTYRPESTCSAQSIRRNQRRNSHTSAQRIPTVRFAELPCQYRAQSAFASPGIYEQQEQRQHSTWEVYRTGDFDDYPWALEEEYMDENSMFGYDDQDDGCWDDMDDMLEASISHRREDEDEMYTAGSPFPMDNVSEDARPGNDVVAPGFWRPNKLY